MTASISVGNLAFPRIGRFCMTHGYPAVLLVGGVRASGSELISLVSWNPVIHHA
jgi:hypothetical protein